MNYRRASATILLLAIAICGGLEVLARVLLPRLSRIEAREIGEYHSVLRPATTPGPRLLVAGNSLLLEGVDFPQVHEALQPEWNAQRFVVEGSCYLDWYYGLRRLLREGARFDAIAVMLTPQEFVISQVRGSYFARRLMSPLDIGKVSRDAGLTANETADLFLSSISEFYGMRGEIRKVILGRLIPGLPALAGKFVTYPGWEPNDQEIQNISEHRLRALRELAEESHARIMLVLPPISNERDGADAVIRAGARVGVEVIRPIPSGSLQLSDYRDGFHLQDDGTRRFTVALVNSIRPVLRQFQQPFASSRTRGSAGHLP